MTLLQLASLLVTLAAAFGVANALFLRLPQTIGILIVSLAVSLGILFLDRLMPGTDLATPMQAAVASLHFSEALLEGMLGLLLFAGALHVKLSDLSREWRLVTLMATLGVGLSTLVAGLGFAWIVGAPLLVALVFGALISPTDPVAVLGILRSTTLPASLETKIAGESLFNDGVGYVVFLVIVGLAFPVESHVAPRIVPIAALFLQEAFGGGALGAVLGVAASRVMRRIDDPSLAVVITVALALGGYQLAGWLDVSAPIMAVVAGLCIGEAQARDVMTPATRAQIDTFWTVIDEMLNAVLFLLIGVEVFAVTFEAGYVLAGLGAIALHLVARFVAVLLPVAMLRSVWRGREAGLVRLMTLGGLKGGISIALVLSLPESEWKPVILTTTYIVVVFSIIVQGLAIAPIARRIGGAT